MPEDMLSQEVEAYDASQSNEQTVGGNKKVKSKKRGPKKVGSKKGGTKKRGSKKVGTKKRRNKKGPSKWIMHVKAFCKKTGKTFPEALKDPMCKKSFKN